MKAVILAVGAGLCWGIGEVFTRSVLHSGRVGPMAAICLRSTVALPVLWLAYLTAAFALRVPGERGWTQADSGTISKLVVGSGLIAGAAAMILFYASLSLGEVSRVKPIAFSIAPATAVVLGWLALGEPMSARKAFAVILILAGVILLTAGGPALRTEA